MATPLTLTESARKRLVGFTKNDESVGPREVDQIISYCREHGERGDEEIHVSENLVEEAYEEVIS